MHGTIYKEFYGFLSMRKNKEGGYIMNLLKLAPAFKDYLWGGTKLKTEYDKKSDLDIVAESWELSNHPAGSSMVVNGEYANKTFIEYLETEGKKVWGTNAQDFENFPVLIKFIDAKQALSIQVHPDDEYALRVEKEFGKNEMWYILDCEPGAFLYYGVNQAITKEEFRTRIENNTILEVLNKVEVHKGDCFFIKAGTIHAIGEGIVICEIQQNSNSTYRVYDFDRRDANGNVRELHIDKAVDVSCLTPSLEQVQNAQKEVLDNGNERELLAACKYFTTERYDVKESVTLHADETSFHSLIILEGEGSVTCKDETVSYRKGDSIFLPAGAGEYHVDGTCAFILTRI